MNDTLSLVRAWGVVAASAFVLAACSLGALDGFSGGVAADGPEAGLEGGAVGDATTDVPTEVTTDATGESFCQSLPQSARVCADFDDGKLPPGLFTEQAGGGSVELGGEGRDGTRGLASVSPSDAATASACAYVAIPGLRTGIVLEAAFRVETSGTDNFDIVNIYTAGDRELGVSTTGPAMFIEEDYPLGGGTQGERQTPVTAVPNNTWRRLRFVVTTNGSVATAELFVDGASVGTHEALLSTATDTTRIEIGDCRLVGAAGWKVHYDNVVVYETK